MGTSFRTQLQRISGATFQMRLQSTSKLWFFIKLQVFPGALLGALYLDLGKDLGQSGQEMFASPLPKVSKE